MAGELRKMGVRLTAEGVNQYKDDLRSAGREARLMSQETKIAMLELGEGASSADKFQTQLKGLDREYDVQKNKLKTLSNAQKEYTTSLGLVEREITSTTSALKTSQSETNRLEKEYRTLAKTTSTSATETNKAKQAFQDSSGTLKTTQNEANRLEKEYRELGKTLGYNATETKKAKQAWQESAAILKSSQADTNRLEKEYRELAKASGLNATESKKAKQAWQESKQETKELATNLNKLEKDQSKYTKELDKMPGKINAAKISMGELSNEMQQLNREYIKNGGHLADVSAKLTSAGDKVKSFSSGLQSAGSTLTTGVTLPLVAMGTAALMAGVKFEQQMSRVGAIAGSTKEELTQLTDQAKALGASTAFSASEVASGMENMASAGFTVSEIMNAMAGVLDLAAVSGGDVALASEAAATAINAFKLEARDAGHVSDVFARAAADTNAEVGDMAEALKYAAPPAANLGLSLEDTAAAIGIMSDASIKGSQAGTTLRGALTRLAKPTSAASDLMTHLGIQMFDAQGKIKPMSQIVTELKDGLAGMTNEQKASTLATIFGQEAMNGMMVLVDAGSEKVDTLSKSLENSAGSAEEMATAMQDNVAGTLDEMMGALETAGIELTEALAPTIKEIAEKVTELVGSFNELDDETQQTIIKWLALAAAAGPMLSAIGSMGQGVGTLIKLGGASTKVYGGLKASLSQTTLATKVAVGSVDDLALAAAGAGGASGVGGLTLALGAALPWIAGITLAVGAGYGAWKIWGEGAYEAGERTKQWGSDICEEADKALDDFQTLSDEAGLATDLMAFNIEDGTSRAITAYSEMAGSIKEDIQETISETEEGLAGLPESVRKIVGDSMTAGVAEQSKLVEEIDTIQAAITGIYENALAENRSVTDEELIIIENYHSRLAEIRSETLKLSAEEQRKVQAVMTEDLRSFSTEQLRQRTEMLNDEAQVIQKGYDKQAKLLEEQLASGVLGREQYNDAMAALNASEIGDLSEIGMEYLKVWQERGDIPLETQKKILADMGLSYAEIQAQLDLNNQQIAQSNKYMAESSKDASEEVRKANDTWNGMILDEKTGKVTTNLDKVITEASESEEGWNNLQFIMQNAELDTNAKEKIMEALMANGMWWEMDFPTQFADVETNAGVKAQTFLQAHYDWEKMKYEDKMAILKSNSPETVKQALIATGVWENLNPTEKELIISTNAGTAAKEALIAIGLWNILTPAEKEMVVTSNSTEEALKGAEASYAWNGTTWVPKEAKVVASSNAPEVAGQSKIAINEVPELKYANILASSNTLTIKGQVDSTSQSADILGSKLPVIKTSTNAPITEGKLKYATTAATILNSQAPYIPVTDNSGKTKGNLDKTTSSAKALNNQAPYIPVTDNSNSTKGNLNATTNAAKILNTQSPYITASTNAPKVKGQIDSAKNAAKDKSFTITGFFKKAGSWLGFATGTPATPYDGTFKLGDGGKREPYLTPSGSFGVSGSTDELHNLPKGTRVWPSRQSFKTSARSNDQLKQYLDMIPKFAKGGTIQNAYDGYAGLVGEAGPEIFNIAKGKVSITPISQGQRTKVLDQQGDGSTVDMSETNNLLQALIQLVAQGQVIQMDGREVGRSIYDEVDSIMNHKFNRGSIMSMKGGG